LKRTSDKSLFPMALGSCGHRITHQLRPINMNGRSILSVMSIPGRRGHDTGGLAMPEAGAKKRGPESIRGRRGILLIRDADREGWIRCHPGRKTHVSSSYAVWLRSPPDWFTRAQTRARASCLVLHEWSDGSYSERARPSQGHPTSAARNSCRSPLPRKIEPPAHRSDRVRS
jgi:hypothetical protein